MSVDVRGLKITIGGKPIVSDADMTIADGERVGLIGSSGSGKSMIAKAMLGLLPLTAVANGSIDMGGTEIIGASERALADLRGRYVGAVFQNPAASLNPVMTVAQQIALPLRLHYDLTKAERADRVNALLSKVGLDLDMAGKYPHELSGGQQQRVGIATALITSPRLIIADEPTTALDSITQRQIVDLLTSLVDDAGASMLFITHDFSVLARATTRCYVLDAGRIVESGPTADLLAAPTTPQAQRLVAAAQTLTLHTPRRIRMSNSSVPLLSARSITKSFGPRTARHQVLFDVSADVHAGECLAVIGGSGSGKSTLTRIMLGLESADSGSVEYEGQSIVGGRKSPGFAALRRESGLVFQDPFSSLDPRWQVAKSVAEPLSLQRRDLNNTDIDERVAAALTMAGLEPADFLNRYPIDLSGGQAQRVVIARAIINEPKVILADEPMSAINVAARIQILDTFAAIRAARPSTAIIMVSHDLGVVQHIADRILVLHDGRLEETGPTAEVLGNPQSDYTRQLIEAASL